MSDAVASGIEGSGAGEWIADAILMDGWMDYLKVGAGPSAVRLAVTLLVVPWRWPVYP